MLPGSSYLTQLPKYAHFIFLEFRFCRPLRRCGSEHIVRAIHLSRLEQVKADPNPEYQVKAVANFARVHEG